MRRILFSLGLLLILPFFTLKAAGEVDLLWQGETYAPPFYEGRSLWTNESRITFFAIPNLAGVDPSSLIYRWKKDGTVLGSLSGINKRTLTLVDSILSVPVEVRVDIFIKEGTNPIGSATVTLRPALPRLVIIEDNPLYGLMFHKAVGSIFNLSEEEVTFSAMPFFARVGFREAPALTYTWRTNAGDSRTGNIVTYRAPEGSSGSSSVTVKVVNGGVLAQPTEKNFLVQFNSDGVF